MESRVIHLLSLRDDLARNLSGKEDHIATLMARKILFKETSVH